MIRVLLIDAHKEFHSAIRTALAGAAEIDLVVSVSDASRLPSLCQQYLPQVILLVPRFEAGRTIAEAASDIRQHFPDAKVLLVLNQLEGVSLEQLVEMPVAGALSVSDPPDMLVGAIRAAASGQLWFSPVLVSALLKMQDEERADGLTPRERIILHLIASGRIDKEVALALGIRERTVRYHLQNIHDKLGTTTRAQVVAVAIRRGLIR